MGNRIIASIRDSIIIITLIFAGIVIVCYMGNSMGKVETIKYEINLDLKSTNSVDKKETESQILQAVKKKLEDTMIDLQKDRVLQTTDLAMNRIYNTVTVTAIFFTVLVVIITVFQYLKSKSYEDNIIQFGKDLEGKYKEHSERIDEMDKKTNESITKAVSNFQTNIMALILMINNFKQSVNNVSKITFKLTKALNYLNTKQYKYAVSELTELVGIVEENEDLGDGIDREQIYYYCVIAYEEVNDYSNAIRYLERILDVNNFKSDDTEYLSTYMKYCDLNYKQALAKKDKDIDELKTVISLYQMFESNSDSEHIGIIDEFVCDTTEKIRMLNLNIGKLYYQRGDYHNAKLYLKECINPVEPSSPIDEKAIYILHSILVSKEILTNTDNWEEFIENFDILIMYEMDKIYFDDCKDAQSVLLIRNKDLLKRIIKYYHNQISDLSNLSELEKQSIRKLYLILRVNHVKDYQDKKVLQQIMLDIYRSDSVIERHIGQTPW